MVSGDNLLFQKKGYILKFSSYNNALFSKNILLQYSFKNMVKLFYSLLFLGSLPKKYAKLQQKLYQ